MADVGVCGGPGVMGPVDDEECLDLESVTSSLGNIGSPYMILRSCVEASSGTEFEG